MSDKWLLCRERPVAVARDPKAVCWRDGAARELVLALRLGTSWRLAEQVESELRERLVAAVIHLGMTLAFSLSTWPPEPSIGRCRPIWSAPSKSCRTCVRVTTRRCGNASTAP